MLLSVSQTVQKVRAPLSQRFFFGAAACPKLSAPRKNRSIIAGITTLSGGSPVARPGHERREDVEQEDVGEHLRGQDRGQLAGRRRALHVLDQLDAQRLGMGLLLAARRPEARVRLKDVDGAAPKRSV